jgi:hypothetical protein
MEDYIYFILLAGWLVYSFYQQDQKKKRRAAELQAAKERQAQVQEYDEGLHEYEEVEKGGTDFKSIFEQLLQGEEEVPAYKPQPVEPIESFDEEAIMESNEFQRYLESDLMKERKLLEPFQSSQNRLEDKIESLQNEMILQEDDHESIEKHDFRYFDLRKAVIYSEILNRKY